MKKLLPFLIILLIASLSYSQKKEYEKFLKSGKEKYNSKDYTGALIDFTEAINARVKEPAGYYWRGLTYYALYKDDKAIKNYSRAIEADDEYYKAYFERGYIRLVSNNYEDALGDFKKATKLNGSEKASWYNLGLCKYYLGDNIGAVTAFNKSIKIDPTYVNAIYNRGLAKYNLGDYGGTISDSDEILAIDPNYVNAYYYKGLGHYNQAQYEESITNFNKVIQLKPEYKDAYYNRALAKYYSGDYQGAISDFDKVVALSPQDAEAHYRRGLANSQLNNLKESEKDFEQALAINPDYAAAEKELEFIRGSASVSTDQPQAKPERRLPQIWAVVVGISQYENADLNLQYADADAKSIYEYLTSPNGGGLDNDHIELLTNEDATRANIIKALTDKFYRAFETDMVMLFIASHGQPDPVGNEVYFLGHDTDDENLSGTGISQIDIEKIFSRSKAGKKVWIADACHSGGAGFTMGARGDQSAALINKLLFQMVLANDGMAMLTASSSSEFSLENEKWGGGHGVFTHYFLEGIQGKADRNQNGVIQIRELYEYIYRNVADQTDGKQHPELKGNFDNDLPLAVVR